MVSSWQGTLDDLTPGLRTHCQSDSTENNASEEPTVNTRRFFEEVDEALQKRELLSSKPGVPSFVLIADRGVVRIRRLWRGGRAACPQLALLLRGSRIHPSCTGTLGYSMSASVAASKGRREEDGLKPTQYRHPLLEGAHGRRRSKAVSLQSP
ncbi:hypothetical protein NDU88_002788 [Pleurodeles waltl]|uniref:Uncharacterized protein n=1 Tax=Pleurodeles waltl TaxID=8319 RepID=A0AAV7UAP3_PLEWA|nr:hypothetical protein NDU88_002788 [Pleurodeles waltl]